MGLFSTPPTRNTTYAAGAQVKSADLNDIQDKLIALATISRTINIPGGAGESPAWAFLASAAGGGLASGWYSPSNNDIVAIPIALPVGARITSISGYIRDTSGGSNVVAMQLFKSDGAASNTQIGSTQTSAGSGANQTLTLGSLTEAVATGKFYHATFKATGSTFTTHAIYGMSVTYDLPNG